MKEDRLAADVHVQRLRHQHRAGLRQRLDDQHAGHHRIMREMALEVGLVHGHALDADDRLAGLVLLAAIDQQERKAVRDPGQDLGDIDLGRTLDDRRLAAHWLSPPRRAFRINHAVSRNHWRSGRAGIPAQVSPAGTSCITAAAAPMLAPDPIVT